MGCSPGFAPQPQRKADGTAQNIWRQQSTLAAKPVEEVGVRQDAMYRGWIITLPAGDRPRLNWQARRITLLTTRPVEK